MTAFSRRIAAGLVLSLALGLSAAAAAPTVSGAWSRPAAAGATGVGFMVVSNPTPRPDTLISVTSPAARSVAAHRSSLSNGMAMMEPAPRVAVPAGGAVRFAPGGYHLMFTGLTRALKAGDSVPAVLTFASGASVKVRFIVAVLPPKGF